jgi:chromosome segregation ATPase
MSEQLNFEEASQALKAGLRTFRAFEHAQAAVDMLASYDQATRDLTARVEQLRAEVQAVEAALAIAQESKERAEGEAAEIVRDATFRAEQIAAGAKEQADAVKAAADAAKDEAAAAIADAQASVASARGDLVQVNDDIVAAQAKLDALRAAIATVTGA